MMKISIAYSSAASHLETSIIATTNCPIHMGWLNPASAHMLNSIVSLEIAKRCLALSANSSCTMTTWCIQNTLSGMSVSTADSSEITRASRARLAVVLSCTEQLFLHTVDGS